MGIDELAACLPEGSGDRTACAAFAQMVAQALVALIDASDANDGAMALRNGLFAKEDLSEARTFLVLLGPQLSAGLAAAGGATRAEDVESSDGSDVGDDDDEES